MAQVFTTKQTGFVQRYATAVAGFLNAVDALTLLDAEFTNNTFGTGGAEAITDAIVQATLPSSTAALFNSGEAAVVAVLATVTANRGTLEMMRA
jgi:hypothetical protein